MPSSQDHKKDPSLKVEAILRNTNYSGKYSGTDPCIRLMTRGTTNRRYKPSIVDERNANRRVTENGHAHLDVLPFTGWIVDLRLSFQRVHEAFHSDDAMSSSAVDRAGRPPPQLISLDSFQFVLSQIF